MTDEFHGVGLEKDSEVIVFRSMLLNGRARAETETEDGEVERSCATETDIEIEEV